MANELRITRITVHRFTWEARDLGQDYNGFNQVYEPGPPRTATGHVLTVETDTGITGEFAGGDGPSYAQLGSVAHYLLGKDPLQRERLWNDIKRAMRKVDRMGLGPLDIALWDLAGKLYQAPIYRLLGGWKETLPAYASTTHGDHVKSGGLSSPEAFADFAVQCKEEWATRRSRSTAGEPRGRGPIEREAATVLETRKRVAPAMDLMLDPPASTTPGGDAQGGQGLRRGGLLLVRGPLPGRRDLAVRAQQAARADQDPPLAGRARAPPGDEDGLRPRRGPPTTSARTPTTTAGSPA